MEYTIGVGLALAVLLGARAIGLDRDRAFYPLVATVVASYYGLFAILGDSMPALARESVVIAGFVAIAMLGFKQNLWFAAAALFAHGVLDFFHARLIANPGVPAWWPGFCLAFDVTAAGLLAWLLWKRRTPATATRSR